MLLILFTAIAALVWGPFFAGIIIRRTRYEYRRRTGNFPVSRGCIIRNRGA